MVQNIDMARRNIVRMIGSYYIWRLIVEVLRGNFVFLFIPLHIDSSLQTHPLIIILLYFCLNLFHGQRVVIWMSGLIHIGFVARV